jgi:hypothetical protein
MSADLDPLIIGVGIGLMIGMPLLLGGIGNALELFAQGYLAKHSKRSGK